eukprot:jgi/Mesvir1/4890/Mv11157-RA.1
MTRTVILRQRTTSIPRLPTPWRDFACDVYTTSLVLTECRNSQRNPCAPNKFRARRYLTHRSRRKFIRCLYTHSCWGSVRPLIARFWRKYIGDCHEFLVRIRVAGSVPSKTRLVGNNMPLPHPRSTASASKEKPPEAPGGDSGANASDSDSEAPVEQVGGLRFRRRKRPDLEAAPTVAPKRARGGGQAAGQGLSGEKPTHLSAGGTSRAASSKTSASSSKGAGGSKVTTRADNDLDTDVVEGGSVVHAESTAAAAPGALCALSTVPATGKQAVADHGAGQGSVPAAPSAAANAGVSLVEGAGEAGNAGGALVTSEASTDKRPGELAAVTGGAARAGDMAGEPFADAGEAMAEAEMRTPLANGTGKDTGGRRKGTKGAVADVTLPNCRGLLDGGTPPSELHASIPESLPAYQRLHMLCKKVAELEMQAANKAFTGCNANVAKLATKIMHMFVVLVQDLTSTQAISFPHQVVRLPGTAEGASASLERRKERLRQIRDKLITERSEWLQVVEKHKADLVAVTRKEESMLSPALPSGPRSITMMAVEPSTSKDGPKDGLTPGDPLPATPHRLIPLYTEAERKIILQVDGLESMIAGVEELCERAEAATRAMVAEYRGKSFAPFPHVNSPHTAIRKVIAPGNM